MKKVHGFSLVEIAIVLVVLGFLLGNLLNPITKKIERDRLKLTQQRLEEIKEALLGYAVIRGCLPCPMANEDDVERRKVGCTACNDIIDDPLAEGFLPWKDLGVVGYDAWGNVFRYRVKDNYTDTRLTSGTETQNSLRITSFYENEKDEKNNLTITSGDSSVVAVIFSYGPNGQAEDDNEDADLTYTYDGYTADQFDDIVTWISKNTVSNYLVTSGQTRYEVEGWELTKEILHSYLCSPPYPHDKDYEHPLEEEECSK